MNTFNTNAGLDFTISIAKAAGEILLGYFGNNPEIKTKSNSHDLVTIADQESEALLIKEIKHKYPDHLIIAEESATNLIIDTNKYTWIIDPLDGTTNFNHNIPHFAVSIGLYKNGEGILAVVYNPVTKELYAATNETQTTLNGVQISVSKTKEFTNALLATGLPYDRTSPEYDKTFELIKEYHETCRGVRRFGAAALDLAWVAAGRVDGFFEYMLKPWDTAAGKILITQAGGRITKETDKFIAADNGKIEWNYN